MATHVEVNEAATTVAGTHTGHGPLTADATGHHGALAHHFDNMEQQRDATTIGMWVFLVTEIMFFGGLFFAYTLYRASNPEAFGAASRLLDIKLGAFNTAVLIGSSLTMALGVYFAQVSKRKPLVWALVATIILGSIFLGVKVIEYGDKFEHKTVPGTNFVYHEPGEENAPVTGVHGGREAAGSPGEGGSDAHSGEGTHAVDPMKVQMFYVLYFAMTGLHAIHMIIGIGALGFLTYFAYRGAYSTEYYSPIELFGLYWHFVDIVWIFLFPLLYLIDRNPLIG